MTTAIIGAGMAGLTAAAGLQASGRTVRLFDKGRGAGGRMATRRTSFAGAEVSFDHGAQYFTARSPQFRAIVENWVCQGAASLWSPRMETVPGDDWFVGTPGMNAILRAAAADHDVTWTACVTGIDGAPRSWWLHFEDGLEEGPFEQVIVAVPPEQAASLLEGVAPDLCAGARRVKSQPCWAVMLAYESNLRVPFQVLRPQAGAIGWAACNSSKPGRLGPATWVVHATADWTEAHLEDSAENVTAHIVRTFRDFTRLPAPDFAQAHRWRLARVEQPLGQAFQYDQALAMATCGDWHLGARIEAAWTSGRLLAEQLR